MLKELFSAFCGAKRNNSGETPNDAERQTNSHPQGEVEASNPSRGEETNRELDATSLPQSAEIVAESRKSEQSQLKAAVSLCSRVESTENELDAYDYALPERLVAQSPSPRRENARMMVVNRATGKIEHRRCYNIVEYLRPDDVLVLNNTKVLPARLIGSRAQTGGRWEGLFLQCDPRGFWELMSKTRGYLRPGEKIELLNSSGDGKTRYLEVVAHTDNKTLVARPILEENEDSFAFLDKVGWVPLPPYIRSGLMKPSDREDYQTVYAQEPGAVAAPTAGLHFTKELLEKIEGSGVAICPVTLHVGAGTFKPISVAKLSEHHMHYEFATISEEVARVVEERKARGGRVFAVGTTSVRTLESASNVNPDGTIDSSGNNDYKLQAFSGQTNLFIRPPYKFKTVDAMLTNFHLPKSTLVILVRTFGGDELLKRAYEEAIAEDYRFYSYGDAMLIV